MVPRRLSVREILILMVKGGVYFSAVKDPHTIHFRIFRKRPVAGDSLLVYIKRDWVDKKFKFAGLIDENPEHRKIGDPDVRESFFWIKNILQGDSSDVKLYQHVKCKRCGRNIYDFKSITNGYGPTCWKVVQERHSYSSSL